jgi:lysophospholipase L1-like esterase
MIGTNEVGYVPLATYRHNMERIVEISIEMGIVPVLSTVPPRIGYEAEVLAYNQSLREISQEQQIPLWDYGHAMRIFLPNSLGFDGVHPSLPAHGREDAANFRSENLFAGYVLRNLSALFVLNQLWQDIVLYEI